MLDCSLRQVLPTEESECLLGYARGILRLADEACAALSPLHIEVALRDLLKELCTQRAHF